MRIVVNNASIVIENADDKFIEALTERLSYKDKSLEYQVKRMEKNPFQKNSPYLKKLREQVHGNLVEKVGDNYVIPSGFCHLISNVTNIVDNRLETGPDISLPWRNRPYPLRDYQEEALNRMGQTYRGIVNMATGLGKTLTSIHAIRRFKKKTLIVCPSASIADNFYEELCKAFGDNRVGYFGGGKKKIKDITVAIAASVNNHVEKFKQADLGLVIFDETHHLAASTFYSISAGLSNTGRMYGLTATNFRSDGKDVMIEAGVGPAIIKRDLVWGIKNNWLADPCFIVREIETVGKDHPGDKIKNYKEHILKDVSMNDRIISDAQKSINAGKSTLILVKEIEHGKAIAEKLGLPFATGTNKKSRQYVIDLNNEKIQGLIGTAQCIGEGTDTKNVDVLIMANFPASKGPLWQNLGRGLRIHKGRNKLIVLDYIPKGSKMLERHAKQRIKFYREITNNVRVKK